MTNDWASEQPACPEWCTNGARHLEFQLRVGGDYWHEGRTTEIPTDDTDHNWNVIGVPLQLIQHIQVDERGYYVHPVQVSVGGHSLSRENAEALADTVLNLARSQVD